MICYRDMTFCQNKDCAKFGKDCFRSLTDQVLKDAKKWWGKSSGNPPICCFLMGDDDPFECFEPIRKDDESTTHRA